MTGRSTAILKGVQQALPHADVLVCCTRLIAGINHFCSRNRGQCLYPKGSGGSGALEIFWQAQQAHTHVEFDMRMNQLQKANPLAFDHLKSSGIADAQWATYAQLLPKTSTDVSTQGAQLLPKTSTDVSTQGCVRTYGIKSNIQAETGDKKLSSSLATKRNPLEFFESLGDFWMECLGKALSRKILLQEQDKFIVSDQVRKEFFQDWEACKLVSITNAVGNDLFTVEGRSPTGGVEVNSVSLSQRSCFPCGQWQTTGRPCKHVIAVWLHLNPQQGSRQAIESLFDACWLNSISC
mmetsp:Transcript_13484/g.46924  ORF Transcript_13484/g.46924 Transcript_13484/m.46924 type:complete len:294 (+) Transcript_13484:505-1386(+)